jgi:hypothetical protein
MRPVRQLFLELPFRFGRAGRFLAGLAYYEVDYRHGQPAKPEEAPQTMEYL